jgi:amphiphysin
VDRNIVRPLLELQEIQRTIAKTMTKRDHKLVDYDRHRIALQKITTKTERSFSEEKQIFKVRSCQAKKKKEKACFIVSRHNFLLTP